MRRHFAYVDLIRGICALAVLVCHYRWFFAEHVGQWRTDAPLPLYWLLWPLYENGDTPVRMFWTLSGFVFWVAYGKEQFSAGKFFIQRIARLYPLHLATLVLVACLQSASIVLRGDWLVYDNNDIKHFLAQLIFASNQVTMAGSFNAPVWSVAVEALIYGLFVIFMLRPNLSGAIGIGAAAMLVERLTYNPVAMCAALFFGGVVVAMLTPHAQELFGKRLPVAAALGCAGVVTLCLVAAQLGYGPNIPTILAYVGTPALLVLFASLDLNQPSLPDRWHWIGAITYSVYLLHMPVLIGLRLVTGDKLPLESPMMLIIFIIVVIGFALPTHRYFERPAQKLVLRLSEKRIGSSPSA